VGIGAGGSYSSYSFNPSTGLSNDPALAPYLQDLTPAQLQTALDGGDTVTQDLSSQLIDDITGTGSFLTSSTAAATSSTAGIPLWVWIAGGGLVALVALKR
jgi:hypothetical protein